MDNDNPELLLLMGIMDKQIDCERKLEIQKTWSPLES